MILLRQSPQFSIYQLHLAAFLLTGNFLTLYLFLNAPPETMWVFFRPISLLPIISKIFEKHIHRILMEFLSSEGLLSDDQFGFRKGRSTAVPLLLATHDWHKSLESKHQVACIFFDFNKAFDSVPHQALLKLYCMQVPSLLI